MFVERRIMKGLRRTMAAVSFLCASAAQAGAPTGEMKHVTCTGAANEVRLTVRNVKESVGLITIELYRNDPSAFLSKEGRAMRVQVAAKSPETHMCLHAPEAVSYAIGLYHDENANNKLDKKTFGLPAEPYGVSNNPRMRFAPPRVDEALFHVTPAGVEVDVKLRGG